MASNGKNHSFISGNSYSTGASDSSIKSGLSNSTIPRKTSNKKKGTLKKKGLWSHWKEAWFVLESSMLMEFKHENATKPSKVYTLSKYTVKLGEAFTGAPYSFGLFAPKKDPVFLLGSSQSEMIEWVTALSELCSSAEIDWKAIGDSTLEGFVDAVIVASEKGVILGVNEQALNLFGYQRKAMIGKPLTMLMTQEYSDRHDGYMQTYNITNNRRLVGKARTLPALHADGTTINVVLSLGEIESEGQRRFIATIRPAQNTSRDEVKSREQIISAVDNALRSFSSDLKDSIQGQISGLYKEIDDLKAKNSKLSLELHKSQKKSSTDLLTDFKTVLKVNTRHIVVNEKLASPGGSGANIYVCTVDGWQCVLKEIDFVEPEDASHIEKEIQILESLPYHKNLVRYLFHEVTKSRIRLFMTRYTTTLSHILKTRRIEGRHFTLEEVVRYTLDMVKGLEVLHEHNIIHRDLKSDNIFVSLNPSGDAEFLSIGDFDTAKVVSSNDAAKTIIGTPGYIAPEILHSANKIEYSFSADIWSVGMVVYEIMSLKRPFEDEDILKIGLMTKKGVLPGLTAEVQVAYAPLVDTWKKCMSVDPLNRPPAKELRQTLSLML